MSAILLEQQFTDESGPNWSKLTHMLHISLNSPGFRLHASEQTRKHKYSHCVFCVVPSFTLRWNAEKPACRISQTHQAFC